MISTMKVLAFAAMAAVEASALPNPALTTNAVAVTATSHWGTACPQTVAVTVGTAGNKYV
jgi:hypothetical protein